MSQISPCLWFDHQAEEAAKFYATVFEKIKMGPISRYGKSGSEVSGQKAGSVMMVNIQIEDLEFNLLNGGPLFKFTQALSFFVGCESEKEISEKWRKLSEGGKVRMGLDKYPWAEKYGWVADKFGVEWQLIQAPRPHKIVPSFLFVGKLFGKGEEAIKYYTALFPNSKIESMHKDETSKTVMHSSFTLNGQGFALMEGQGKHDFAFNEATSLIVTCKDQAEIDKYWSYLTKGGSEQPCGWLKDKYGVSWQIIPAGLGAYMANPEKAERGMKAILKMKKFDLAALEKAIGG